MVLDLFDLHEMATHMGGLPHEPLIAIQHAVNRMWCATRAEIGVRRCDEVDTALPGNAKGRHGRGPIERASRRSHHTRRNQRTGSIECPIEQLLIRESRTGGCLRSLKLLLDEEECELLRHCEVVGTLPDGPLPR